MRPAPGRAAGAAAAGAATEEAEAFEDLDFFEGCALGSEAMATGSEALLTDVEGCEAGAGRGGKNALGVSTSKRACNS